MTTKTLVLTVRFAWWLEPYLWCLVFVAASMRREPNWAHVGRVIDLACTVEAAP